MESKDQVTQEQAAIAGEKALLQDMQFDVEDDLLKIKQSDAEHDQELLQIQRRKSTPKVVIEEYVADDDDADKDVDNLLDDK